MIEPFSEPSQDFGPLDFVTSKAIIIVTRIAMTLQP
jgi:hypothetical protein